MWTNIDTRLTMYGQIQAILDVDGPYFGHIDDDAKNVVRQQLERPLDASLSLDICICQGHASPGLRFKA